MDKNLGTICICRAFFQIIQKQTTLDACIQNFHEFQLCRVGEGQQGEILEKVALVYEGTLIQKFFPGL